MYNWNEDTYFHMLQTVPRFPTVQVSDIYLFLFIQWARFFLGNIPKNSQQFWGSHLWTKIFPMENCQCYLHFVKSILFNKMLTFNYCMPLKSTVYSILIIINPLHYGMKLPA